MKSGHKRLFQRAAKVIIQRVEHDPRVHLDIETDDKEAEAARLIALGAKPVGKVKNWHVLEGPSGHRFCLIGPTRNGFEDKANVWEKDAEGTGPKSRQQSSGAARRGPFADADDTFRKVVAINIFCLSPTSAGCAPHRVALYTDPATARP